MQPIKCLLLLAAALSFAAMNVAAMEGPAVAGPAVAGPADLPPGYQPAGGEDATTCREFDSRNGLTQKSCIACCRYKKGVVTNFEINYTYKMTVWGDFKICVCVRDYIWKYDAAIVEKYRKIVEGEIVESELGDNEV
jgi:hypothetical protein